MSRSMLLIWHSLDHAACSDRGSFIDAVTRARSYILTPHLWLECVFATRKSSIEEGERRYNLRLCFRFVFYRNGQ